MTQTAASIAFAFMLGIAPFSLAYRTMAWAYGARTPPMPWIMFTLALLLVSPAIGYWAYQTYEVVLRS